MKNIKEITTAHRLMEKDKGEKGFLKKLIPETFRVDIRKVEDDWYLIMSYEQAAFSVDIGLATDHREDEENKKGRSAKPEDKTWGFIGSLKITIKDQFKLSLLLGMGSYKDEKSKHLYSSMFGVAMGIPVYEGITATLGYGYNRDFVLPDFDDLDEFPLLPSRELEKPEMDKYVCIEPVDENTKSEKSDVIAHENYKGKDDNYIRRKKKKINDQEAKAQEKIKKILDQELNELDYEYSKKIHKNPKKKVALEKEKEFAKKRAKDAAVYDEESIKLAKKRKIQELKDGDKQRKKDRKRGGEVDEMFEQMMAIKYAFPPKKDMEWITFGIEGEKAGILLSILLVLKLNEIGGIGKIALNIPQKLKNGKKRFIQLNFIVLVQYNSSEQYFKCIGKIASDSFILTPKMSISGGIVYINDEDGSFLSLGFPLTNGKLKKVIPTPFKISFKSQKGGIDVSYKLDAYYASNPALKAFGFHGKIIFKLDYKKAYIDVLISAGVDSLSSYHPNVSKVKLKALVSVTFQIRIKWFSLRLHLSLTYSWQHVNFNTKQYDKSKIKLCGWEHKFSDDKMPTLTKKIKFSDIQNLLPINKILKDFEKKNPQSTTSNDTPEKIRNFANVAISNGQIKGYPEDKKEKKLVWIIDPINFVISTSTTIPANHVRVLGQEVNNETTFIKKVEIQPQMASHPHFSLHNIFKERVLSHEGKPIFLQKTNSTTNKENTPFLPENRMKPDQWLGLSPMGQRIDSVHHVGLYKYPIKEVGGKPVKEAVNHLLVQLETNSYPRKWFGSQILDIDQPSNNKFKSVVIENALSGVNLSPLPFFPSRTKSINWYWLVFSPGNSMGIGPYDLPKAKKPLRLATKIKDLKAISVDSNEGISILKELDNTFFDGLAFEGNRAAKISYWDRPLESKLAEEVNQNIKNRGYKIGL